MKRALLACVLLSGVPTFADEVILRGGGRLSGVVVERTPDRIVLDVGPGQVTLPMSRVEKVVAGRSPLAAFRDRASQTPREAAAWYSLGEWAQASGLETQAREAFERAIEIDPAYAPAHLSLGHLQQDGRWMSEDESFRARGYVFSEGRWMTPAEHEAILRERAEYGAAARAQAEGDARVREAEARARTAEAEARRVEAEAAQASDPDYMGIPYWWGGGGSTVIVAGSGRPHHRHGGGGHGHGHRPPPPRVDPPRRPPHDAATPSAPARSAQAGVTERARRDQGRDR
jgi:hypothetical protein